MPSKPIRFRAPQGHELAARFEVPAAERGMDTGPSPYDLPVAALGACTATTIQVYAEHKKIPLERVIVDLALDKVHAVA